MTNFLDFHFGEANPQFGTPQPEIYETLVEAAAIVDPAGAEPLYVEANNAIKELVPMVPVAHGGNATGYLAAVQNPQASPLSEAEKSLLPLSRATHNSLPSGEKATWAGEPPHLKRTRLW